jgi:hypothetical protein
MSSQSAAKSNPIASFVAVSRELISHPFAAGDDLAKRAGAPRKYLVTGAALFVVAPAVGFLAHSVSLSPTLAQTQWLVLGLLLAALVIGNVVALVLARTSRTKVEFWRFTAAAQYLVGLALGLLAVLTVVALVGQLVISGWNDSLLEALVVIGYLAVGVLAMLALLEVPRRILHLTESTYYGVVALVFLGIAGVARNLGLAG